MRIRLFILLLLCALQAHGVSPTKIDNLVLGGDANGNGHNITNLNTVNTTNLIVNGSTITSGVTNAISTVQTNGVTLGKLITQINFTGVVSASSNNSIITIASGGYNFDSHFATNGSSQIGLVGVLSNLSLSTQPANAYYDSAGLHFTNYSGSVGSSLDADTTGDWSWNALSGTSPTFQFTGGLPVKMNAGLKVYGTSANGYAFQVTDSPGGNAAIHGNINNSNDFVNFVDSAGIFRGQWTGDGLLVPTQYRDVIAIAYTNYIFNTNASAVICLPTNGNMTVKMRSLTNTATGSLAFTNHGWFDSSLIYPASAFYDVTHLGTNPLNAVTVSTTNGDLINVGGVTSSSYNVPYGATARFCCPDGTNIYGWIQGQTNFSALTTTNLTVIGSVLNLIDTSLGSETMYFGSTLNHFTNSLVGTPSGFTSASAFSIGGLTATTGSFSGAVTHSGTSTLKGAVTITNNSGVAETINETAGFDALDISSNGVVVASINQYNHFKADPGTTNHVAFGQQGNPTNGIIFPNSNSVAIVNNGKLAGAFSNGNFYVYGIMNGNGSGITNAGAGGTYPSFDGNTITTNGSGNVSVSSAVITNNDVNSRTISGNLTISGILIAATQSNQLSGSLTNVGSSSGFGTNGNITGNGSAITSLTGANLTGTVAYGTLPGILGTLSTNNGNALTNLNGANLVGSIPQASVPTTVLTNNDANARTIIGNLTVSGILTATTQSNQLSGSLTNVGSSTGFGTNGNAAAKTLTVTTVYQTNGSENLPITYSFNAVTYTATRQIGSNFYNDLINPNTGNGLIEWGYGGDGYVHDWTYVTNKIIQGNGSSLIVAVSNNFSYLPSTYSNVVSITAPSVFLQTTNSTYYAGRNYIIGFSFGTGSTPAGGVNTSLSASGGGLAAWSYSAGVNYIALTDNGTDVGAGTNWFLHGFEQVTIQNQ